MFGETTGPCPQSSSPLLASPSVHPLPHQPPHLELHYSLCRDVDWFEGLRILCSSRRRLPHFKDPEVAEFQAVALGKLRDNLIEEVLHYRPDSAVLAFSPLCDSVHKFFFRYCCHQPTLKPDCWVAWIVYARSVAATMALYGRIQQCPLGKYRGGRAWRGRNDGR